MFHYSAKTVKSLPDCTKCLHCLTTCTSTKAFNDSCRKFANFCCLNTQSACNKTHAIVDYIIEIDIALCVITESRLKQDEEVIAGEFTLNWRMATKNVLQFWLSYIRTMSQFRVLHLISFLTGHFTQLMLSLYWYETHKIKRNILASLLSLRKYIILWLRWRHWFILINKTIFFPLLK